MQQRMSAYDGLLELPMPDEERFGSPAMDAGGEPRIEALC